MLQSAGALGVLLANAVFWAAPPLAAQQAVTPTFARSFAVETAGGVLGSAAGIGLGLAMARPDECGNEDLACILRGVGATGLVAAITAPLGTYVLGKTQDTRPSALGAALGSIAGLAAGAGLIKLFDEAGSTVDGVAAVAVVSITHGAVTALGSRLAAALRDD